MITFSTLLVFIPVYALAVASPGPAVAAVLARTMGQGTQGAAAFIFGLVMGDLTWFAGAALGLSLIAKTYAPLFKLIQYGGAAYLLSVAWTLWHTPAKPLENAEKTGVQAGFSAFLGSYLLTLGNPKTMIFFVSIMPLVLNPEQLTMQSTLLLSLVIAIVLSSVFFAYVFLANRARMMLRSTRAIGVIQKTTAGMMAGTALVVAMR
jgi:threonine/homoserine/homoserine lactone efflux protein